MRSVTIRLVFGNASFCEAPPPEGLALPHDTMPTRRFADGVAALQPHLVLAQEVLEWHVPQLQAIIGLPYAHFTPMHHILELAGARNRLGTLVLSRLPFDEEPRVVYYGGFADDNPELWSGWRDLAFDGERLSCAYTEVAVVVGAIVARFGNIHHTWSPKAEYTPVQHANTERLVRAIGPGHDVLWAGDTNLPRGISPGWELLARYWRDNMPPEFVQSLDERLHPAVQKYGIQRMVDGLWTPYGDTKFTVHNVRPHSGLSDHLVFSAEVDIRQPRA